MVVLGVDRVLGDSGAAPGWASSGKALGLLTSRGSPPGPGAAQVDLPGQAGHPGPAGSPRALLHSGFPIARLFSPEHGLGATEVDGVPVPDGVDPETGLPVTSLYRGTVAPPMESLSGLDGVLVDLQDVGARFYTYIWTLSHLMAACARARIPVAILDRPNPLGGRPESVEGPLPDRDLSPSFLCRWPVPIRHSLTMGEMALLLRGEMKLALEVAVVSMAGWRREMTWPETGIPFRPPSPGLPDSLALFTYPALALLEATNVLEGRGTPLSFQWFGAPWVDEEALVSHLRDLGIPGLEVESRARAVPGVRLKVTGPGAFRPVAAGLQILALLRTLFPQDFSWQSYPTAVNPGGEDHLLHLLRSRELVRILEGDPGRLLDQKFLTRCTTAPGWWTRVTPYLLYSCGNPMPSSWTPPKDWIRLTTLEVHTAGEPLRIITGGFPEIPGHTILEKRRYAREHLDHLRTALLWEPRGHADMYGALPLDPVTPDGDLGVLFLHNEGYSTMCGHGIIGLAMAGVEGGVIRPRGRAEHGDGERPDPEIGAQDVSEPADASALTLRMDTPAGRVTAVAHRESGTVGKASFLNVPSFVYALNETVDVPGMGAVRYDIAFGGAFYAFCRAEELGVSLDPAHFRSLMDMGMRVKRAVMDTHPLQHPFSEELSFLYGTVIVGEPRDPAHHSRNVCIFADGEVDRSPTGTGVSARAALHHARGELELGQEFTVESILGTTFTGRVEDTTVFGPYSAVIPRVTGTSHITGRGEILIDPRDPLRNGFILR